MSDERNSAEELAAHLILAGAAPKTDGERQRFLDDVCGSAPRVRDQVEKALHGSEGDSLAGSTVAEYAIVRTLGRGAMGVVYLAHDPTLDRHVALKRMRFHSTDREEAVARFLREMRAVARLSHPNIVAAHHATEHDGDPYLVMEYVPGSDLATIVRERGPVDAAQAIDWILQAARGLQHAHEQGIIHRDIKPANLLLHENGTVKILDLGLARMEGLSAADSGLTQSGMVMGTVDFMAPEQATEARQADERTDIYGLGCTLYYLLNGRPPFDGETVFSKMRAHVETPIPPLGDSPTPARPKKLDAVFQRMVAKAPEDRYQSMAEVVTALEECAAEPALRESGRRSTNKTVAAALVLVLLGVGATVIALRKSATPDAPEIRPTADASLLPLKTPPTGGTGNLTDSGQRLGDSWSVAAKLGDLDGDGDLDAVVANYGKQNDLVWLNDGSGHFTQAGALGSGGISTAIDLGDLDGDGDLDAVVSQRNTVDRVFLNDGKGGFSPFGDGLSAGFSRSISLGDLNGDGALDAVISSGGAGARTPNTIWIGDGKGNFRDSGQQLGQEASWQAALADLDGDGDLDIVFANGDDRGDSPRSPNTIWLNDGKGTFAEGGQPFSVSFSRGVTLGDIDGDGDLDALVGNDESERSGIWINAGDLTFTRLDPPLGIGQESKPVLADLDGDGGLDAILPGVGDGRQSVRWINEGGGTFSAPQYFGNSKGTHAGIDVGDLDGDGDWDVFLPLTGPNEVWFNGAAAPTAES